MGAPSPSAARAASPWVNESSVHSVGGGEEQGRGNPSAWLKSQSNSAPSQLTLIVERHMTSGAVRGLKEDARRPM